MMTKYESGKAKKQLQITNYEMKRSVPTNKSVEAGKWGREKRQLRITNY
jgi:hypothetical protein